MKISPKTSLVGILTLAFSIVAGLLLAQAQDTGASGSTTRKNPEAISSEEAAELQAIEQQPTVEPSSLPYGGRGGTYYSAQCPYWPALPGNIFSLPLWNLGDGYYLIDDLSIDYTAMDTNSTATSASMGARFRPDGGGGFSPDFSTANGPYLTIAPTSTNQFLLTVFNSTNPAVYEIWWTPALANPDYPWQQLFIGASGQTNFTVGNLYPAGFFRAIWDTNGVPTSGLTITIQSPLNGSVLN
jgi:hypothetical protein